MTSNVTRHGSPATVDEEAVQELGKGLTKAIQRLDRRLERSPGMFGGIAMNEALMHVHARLALNPNASRIETWEAVVTAMQVHSALFASAAANEGTVECRIDHDMRTLPATGPQVYANAGSWLTAFWFAIACRDQARMTQLCEVSLDLLRASGAQGDEYVYHWVDSLQTYWRETPGLVEKLTTTMNTSSPEIATIAPRDLLQNVLYQPINLFYRFLLKDHDAFNQALLEAVETHKAYWTADEDRGGRIAGCLALGPLAIACLAYDAGFPIEVESDYLPKPLLERSWLGEFPT